MTHSEAIAAVITAIRARLRGEELPVVPSEANADLLDSFKVALGGADVYHLAEIGSAAVDGLHAAMHAQVRAQQTVLRMQRGADGDDGTATTH